MTRTGPDRVWRAAAAICSVPTMSGTDDGMKGATDIDMTVHPTATRSQRSGP